MIHNVRRTAAARAATVLVAGTGFTAAEAATPAASTSGTVVRRIPHDGRPVQDAGPANRPPLPGWRGCRRDNQNRDRPEQHLPGAHCRVRRRDDRHLGVAAADETVSGPSPAGAGRSVLADQGHRTELPARSDRRQRLHRRRQELFLRRSACRSDRPDAGAVLHRARRCLHLPDNQSHVGGEPPNDRDGQPVVAAGLDENRRPVRLLRVEGTLLPQYYSTYALYMVRALQDYATHGIPVDYLGSRTSPTRRCWSPLASRTASSPASTRAA